MRTITVRVTDDELSKLNALSAQNNAPIGTLVRMAAIKLAEKMGAAKREAGSSGHERASRVPSVGRVQHHTGGGASSYPSWPHTQGTPDPA